MGLFSSGWLGDTLNVGLSAIPGVGEYMGGKETNAAQVAQSSEQMAFQERMSNTAHERESADLLKSGLNPMLSGMGGSGSSSPQGSQAQIQNYGGALGKTTSSALDALSLKKDLEQKDASIALADAQSKTEKTKQALNSAEAVDLEETNTANKGNDWWTYQSNAKTAKAENDYRLTMDRNQIKYRNEQIGSERAGFRADTAQSTTTEMNERFNQKANTYDNIMKRVDNAVGTASSAASIIKPSITIRDMKNERNQERRDYHRVHKKTGEIKND